MAMRVVCPGCKSAYTCAEERRGMKLKCSKCQQVFRVGLPAVSTAPPAVPPDAAKAGESSQPPAVRMKSSGAMKPAASPTKGSPQVQLIRPAEAPTVVVSPPTAAKAVSARRLRLLLALGLGGVAMILLLIAAVAGT